MTETFLVKITEAPELDLACGECGGIIYGYDEVYCPSCGSFIDMRNEKEMTEKEFFAVKKYNWS